MSHFTRRFCGVFLFAFSATFILPGVVSSASIKVGIIGLDAHAVPWTQIIHGTNATPPISDLRVVAAVPTFSADVPLSKDNIDKNTAIMRELGVEICDSIENMISKVDAVLLLSIDGRPHLQQARPVFSAKKPLFVDKPVASSLAEVIEIYREAASSNTPIFSNSSLRYSPGIAGMANDARIGKVLGCDAFCNNQSILPAHPDLYYYGIHGCEILFTIMGSGCEKVRRMNSNSADMSIGLWKDGRIGTFRGILKGQTGFGATVYGEKGIQPAGKFEGYEPLLVEIAKFFQTGKAPISIAHTLEIYAFMEAADESLRQGGSPISIDSVLEKARMEADARWK